MNEDAFNDLPGGEQQAFRVAYLVAGFMRRDLAEKEHQELDDWIAESMDNQRLFEKLIDPENHGQWLKEMAQVNTAAALARIKGKMVFEPERKKSRVKSLWVYAAAACILIAVMIGFLSLPTKKIIPEPKIVQTNPADILPGANRATLTLANGNKLLLDSSASKALKALPGGNLKLDSGGLAYQPIDPTMLPQANGFNTLITPAGGQFKLVLPDGTRVWLNASSSLQYPLVFGNGKRVVELKGEGYFVVAKDPAHPFEVNANGSTVQVLGTHFNVNAYTDEPLLQVVLAEGSIKLNSSVVLKPGEAGGVNKNGRITTSKADLESVLAWKQGQFVFKETPIDQLLRQVARWYNAEIIYENKPVDHFNAVIPRDVPVSRLLHLLEGTGTVHFKIDNHKITVMK